MLDPFAIRDATPADLDRLTEVAHRAKAHWSYPADWFDGWRDELTYTAARLADEDVFVAVNGDGVIGGAASISVEAGDAVVEGMWVDPSAMGRGVGRALFEEAVQRAASAGARRLFIDSDPHALGFYEHMGAQRIGEVPSTIAGRSLPRLLLPLG